MTRRQPDGRDGEVNSPAAWLQVVLGVVVVAALIAVMVPQGGSSAAADLRPLALGVVGLGMVAWLAARRRRQATPARSR